MSVTNAISSVIIVGAIIAGLSEIQIIFNIKYFLFFSNSIGQKYFWVFSTQRMLAMYKKKKRISNDISKFISDFYLISEFFLY